MRETLTTMGGVVAYRLRSQLRHHWTGLLGLAVLVAVLGGIVLATTAGARRTASAYDRLLTLTNPPELLVSPPGEDTDATPFYDAVGRLDGVRGVRLAAGIPVVPERGTPSERLGESIAGGAVLAPFDGMAGSDIGRPHVVDGRLPDPDRPEEVLVSKRFSEHNDVHVGDLIDAVVLTGGSDDLIVAASADQGQPIRLTVTGIGVLFDEVVPDSGLSESGSVIATAPLGALVDQANRNFEGAWIDVQPGTDLDALAAEIEALGQHEELGTGGPVFLADQAALARRVDDAMQPLAVSLAIAAIAIGLVALLVVGQAVSRASRESRVEIEALQAIGSQPGDRAALTLARAAVIGTVGAVGAVVVAVAMSSLFPIGVARVAEPDPGMRVDGLTLAIGAGAIIVLTVCSAVPAAVLGRDRRAQSTARPSRLAGAAAAGGLSVAAIQGVRFVASGTPTRPVPMRSTLFAMTAAIFSVLATVTFAASLLALLDTPSRYGQGWARMVDAQFGPAPVTRILDRLEADPNVTGIAAGNYGDVSVNGLPVPAFDLKVLRGDVTVGIIEGGPPTTADEVVLGSETFERLGLEIGDTVDVDAGAGARPMQVTGRGVFPQMGQGSFSSTGLGVGAVLGGDSLVSFGDFDQVPADYELDGRRYNFVAISTAGPATTIDAALSELEATAATEGAFFVVHREQPPTKIRDLERVRVVPMAMAAALSLVAVAALVHLLVTSVRERRRELALLRALGFSRRQLYASVSWQATIIALAALVIGSPLGVAFGRAVWRWFADGLGAAAPPETPWLWIGVAVVATVVLANVVAAVPGRSAARTRPAIVLRDE